MNTNYSVVASYCSNGLIYTAFVAYFNNGVIWFTQFPYKGKGYREFTVESKAEVAGPVICNVLKTEYLSGNGFDSDNLAHSVFKFLNFKEQMHVSVVFNLEFDTSFYAFTINP